MARKLIDSQVRKLRMSQLRSIVEQIRQILWLEWDHNCEGGTWNPDKEHSYDTLDYIAGVL
jgi:hypothetical protein